MPMNLVQIQKQLQLNDQLISKKDFKTFADNYSRDGQLFVDHGHVLQGREAIEAYVRQRQEAAPGLKMDFQAVGVEEVGDCVISHGTYTSMLNDKKDHGKWLHVLCKEDGSLKIKYSMWNSSLPHQT